MALHLKEIQLRSWFSTPKDLVLLMKIPTTMCVYFHLQFYLPATSFTTVWVALTRTRYNNYLLLWTLPNTFRSSLTALQRNKTPRISLNFSQHSCGSSVISHCNWLTLKMSQSTKRSTLKKLWQTRKDSVKALKPKIEFVACLRVSSKSVTAARWSDHWRMKVCFKTLLRWS